QDYEMFEQQTPHLLLEHELLTDSAGAGQWRGGLGVKTRILLGGKHTQLVTFGDGDVEPAFGLMGGKDSTLNYIDLHYPDGKTYRTTSKDLVKEIPEGTEYVQEAGGGGGYGDPRKRPVEKVVEEVRNETLSVERARTDYGVVIDPQTFEVDAARTGRLRSD
ncbi:MAG: hydantoinase B/oxoprolinase family protein, partial [Planctomycetes bacterium]|nr:hydantoinase B/oxoprolinase family protein [Planctomycetota bacterium]